MAIRKIIETVTDRTKFALLSLAELFKQPRYLVTAIVVFLVFLYILTFFRDGAKDNDVLHDGDELKVVVRAIDQRAYDYLYSMQHMSSTGTNPIENFTGGCLGYFSAHSQIEYYQDFYYSDVVEDDEEI